MHGLVTVLTVDTSSLTDGVQTLMDSIFPWVGVAMVILAPIAAIGIGFKFGGSIINLVKGALGSLGGK